MSYLLLYYFIDRKHSISAEIGIATNASPVTGKVTGNTKNSNCVDRLEF